MAAPNRLSLKHKQSLTRPLVDALIAFRLGRGTEDHYYDLGGALFIASEIVQVVARHRHLKPDVDQALAALRDVHQRKRQRTIADAYWAATEDEMVSLELGVEIYKALLDTTPGPQVLRSMRRVLNVIDKKLRGQS